jgi:hypothetical protein
MPVLRWPHDNHRDVRARLNATISADHDADQDQDRYLMSLIAPPSIITAVCSNCRSMPGNDGARQNRTAKVPSQHDCPVIELCAASGPAPVLAFVVPWRADSAGRRRPHKRYRPVQSGAGLRWNDVRGRRFAQHHAFEPCGREPRRRGRIPGHFTCGFRCCAPAVVADARDQSERERAPAAAVRREPTDVPLERRAPGSPKCGPRHREARPAMYGQSSARG